MSHKKRVFRQTLESQLRSYCDSRTFELQKYSEYHMRIFDKPYTVLDCWTTGKYYVLQTNYVDQSDKTIIERGGEKGELPYRNLDSWLDKLFFKAEMEGNQNG